MKTSPNRRPTSFPMLMGFIILTLMLCMASAVGASHMFRPGNKVTVSWYCESKKTILRLADYLVAGEGDKAEAYFRHPDTDCYKYYNSENIPVKAYGVILRVVSSTTGSRGKIRFVVIETRMNYDGSVVFSVGVAPIIQEPTLNDTKDRGGILPFGNHRRDV